MPDAFDHCEEMVRAGDKDRFLATLFAPEKYRRALHALYAFNLEIARVRELAREPMPGEIRLQWWRDALLRGGQGEARDFAATRGIEQAQLDARGTLGVNREIHTEPVPRGAEWMRLTWKISCPAILSIESNFCVSNMRAGTQP